MADTPLTQECQPSTLHTGNNVKMRPGSWVFANSFATQSPIQSDGLRVDGTDGVDSGARIYSAGAGTSFATPSVAGAAQLVSEMLRRQYEMYEPSPALVKANLVATAHFIDGNDTHTTDTAYLEALPSRFQGFGRVDIDAALDAQPAEGEGEETYRYEFDQEATLKNAAPYWSISGTIVDGEKPVRIALVWTDPASEDTSGTLVNDLDLWAEVTTSPARMEGGCELYTNILQGNDSDDNSDLTIVQPCVGEPSLEHADHGNNVEVIRIAEEYYPSDTPITVHVDAYSVVAPISLSYYSCCPLHFHTAKVEQDFALVITNFIPD